MSVTSSPLAFASVGKRCGAGPAFEGSMKGRQAFKADLSRDVFNRLLALPKHVARNNFPVVIPAKPPPSPG